MKQYVLTLRAQQHVPADEVRMKVQLTRKLSEMLDGIDLSGARVGDLLELPSRDALILIAEGWALFVPEGKGAGRDKAHDRPRRTRPGRTRLNHTKR